VQDLSYLENALNTTSPRFTALNMALISVIEDYSLVGFETLAVEVGRCHTIRLSCCVTGPFIYTKDKDSMMHLSRAIDRATGYIFVPPQNAPAPAGTIDSSSAPASARPNLYPLFTTAAGPMAGTVKDVQERWIDAKEEYDAFEKREWRREGELLRDQAARERAKENEGKAKAGGIRERK
jgi:hypothetical protein